MTRARRGAGGENVGENQGSDGMKKRNMLFVSYIVFCWMVCSCSEFKEQDKEGAESVPSLNRPESGAITEIRKPPENSGLAIGAMALDKIEIIKMPFLDNRNLIRRDHEMRKAMPAGQIVPWSTAEPVKVNITPVNEGTWELLKDGSALWRTRIASKGAHAITLGFERYEMTPGGEMHIYSKDYRYIRGPFTAEDNQEHGRLWLPRIPGDEIVVEVKLPAGEVSQLGLKLTSVNHVYKGKRSRDEEEEILYTEDSVYTDGTPICEDFPEGCPDTLGCNVDVACVSNDLYSSSDPESLSHFLPKETEWILPIHAVGQLEIYGGVCNCSGTLVNNTNNDGTPYLLTAAHCFSTCLKKKPSPGEKSFADQGWDIYNLLQDTTVYWNYETPSCRDYKDTAADEWNPDNMALAQATIGGASPTILENWPVGNEGFDTILMRLNGSVEGINVYFAGWDRSGDLPSTVVGVHHPKAQEKRISVDVSPMFIFDDNDIGIWKWDIGVVQTGSSGSPLFDNNGRIVGSAASRGEYLDCDDSPWNDYARIYKIWSGLSQHLDPSSTGATAINGYAPCGKVKSNGTVSSSAHTVDACMITAGPNYNVTGSAQMTFNADWVVYLKNGFRASPTGSGSFRARIN